MIVPYGHGSRRAGGIPWVTISIFTLCLAVFVITSGAANRSAIEADERFAEVAETYLAQPTLELDPQLEDLIYRRLGVDENQREVFRESIAEQSRGGPRGGAKTSQGDFDQMVDRFWISYRGSPHFRFGVVPSRISIPDLVTYQFLHGGWGHLLGNLLFLYLAAPHIESRWGRPFFLTFYLLAGIVAALFWAFRYPGLDVPLVGASGSIAGLMGAFLICFGTSKIRFFYWFFIVWGTFEAPAWLMLPLWLVMEVISGRTMDVMSQGSGGGGVAHWAHVWGFIFGMAFAGGMSLLGVDRRLAERSGVDQSSEDGHEEVDRAFDLAREGQVDEALELLRDALRSDPGYQAAAQAIWTISLTDGRPEEAVPEMLGLIRRAARTGSDHGIADNWRALVDAAPGASVDPVLADKIIAVLKRSDGSDLLGETLRRVEMESTADLPPGVLVRLAKSGVDQRLPEARRMITIALSSAGLSDADRRELEGLEIRTPQDGGAGEAPRPEVIEVVEDDRDARVELRPAERLKVMEAAPRELDGSILVFEVEDGRRRLDLTRVEAIAVGAVNLPGKRPFLIIDLVLDALDDGTGDLRAVRLKSSSFDPRRLVGGENAMESFKILVAKMLELAGAVPVPNGERLRAPASTTYLSVEEYQQEVLGVMG